MSSDATGLQDAHRLLALQICVSHCASSDNGAAALSLAKLTVVQPMAALHWQECKVERRIPGAGPRWARGGARLNWSTLSRHAAACLACQQGQNC